jgi:Fe-S cluster assembly protein SufB
VPPGLSEEIVRLISAKKGEPDWMLEWRLKALRHWQTMTEPRWPMVQYPPIDFQQIVYYSAPKQQDDGPKSLDEVDPKLLETYEKLGIPLRERERLAGVAVDAVFDSVSVATTFKDTLAAKGVIFCSFSEAVREHPDLVRKYSAGGALPDNFYAALNSAVFTDGSFCFIPKGVRCPMELSTYFRINAANTGQFERTLIVAEEGESRELPGGLHRADARREPVARRRGRVGGTRERRDQVFHRAELVSRRRERQGRHLQLRDQTRPLQGPPLEDLLDPGRDRVGHHLEISQRHPPRGRRDRRVLFRGVTNNYQQADTGTKMVHLGRRTRSTIISKGISAGHGQNSYRGQVKIGKGRWRPELFPVRFHADRGPVRGAHFPYIEVHNSTASVEHEASTSKIGEDQIFYCNQRGLQTQDAVNMIVNGFCKEVFKELPMEFAVEAQKLLGVSLEGSVG